MTTPQNTPKPGTPIVPVYQVNNPSGGGSARGGGGGGGRSGGGGAPLVPVVLLGAGAFLVWFGVHYWRSTTAYPTDVIKSILQGSGLPPVVKAEAPQLATAGQEIQNEIGTLPSGVGGAIAAYALQFVGQGYQYGGRADRPGNWDCSSFLSYVLGHGFNLALPGGGHYGDPGYPPNEHGPVASAYKLYGAFSVNQDQIQPGDLAVWNTHCGVCLGDGRIVAARTEATGTGTSVISGVTAELSETPVFRRVFAPSGAGQQTGGGGGAPRAQ